MVYPGVKQWSEGAGASYPGVKRRAAGAVYRRGKPASAGGGWWRW